MWWRKARLRSDGISLTVARYHAALFRVRPSSNWSAPWLRNITSSLEQNLSTITFWPGISTSKTQEVENGEQQEETIYAASNNHVLRGQEVSLYAEDNFNLNSHLSLNAGIRASLFSTQGKNYCSIQPRLSTRLDFGAGSHPRHPIHHRTNMYSLLSYRSLPMPTYLWVPITKNIRRCMPIQYSLGGCCTGSGWLGVAL